MLKIVITGATGLLGKNMTSLLKKENIDFISLKTRICSIKKDLLIIREFRPDILFHFAAQKHTKMSRIQKKNFMRAM